MQQGEGLLSLHEGSTVRITQLSFNAHPQQGCLTNRILIEIAIWPTAVFKSHLGAIMLKEKCVSKISLN